MFALRWLPRELLSGGLSLGVYLGMEWGLTLVWWVDVTAALLTYGALHLVIARKKEADEIQARGLSLTQAELHAKVNNGLDMARQFAALAKTIPQSPMAPVLQDISQVVEQIFNHFLDDPSDYRKVFAFVDNDISLGLKLAEFYTKYSQTPGLGSEEQQMLQDKEKVIHKFLEGCQQCYRKCLEDDFQEFDLHADYLHKLLDSESFTITTGKY